MQKSKFVIVFLLFISIFVLFGCGRTDEAGRFKEEYEGLNNAKDEAGQKIRNVKISSKNPIKYKSEDEIVDAINNKDTFVVLFGYPSCPWTRSIVETLMVVARENSLDDIYYVNVEDIRDEYTIKDGKAVLSKEGTQGYSELLGILSNILSEYTLNDGSKIINVGEKRIYTPNLVGVIKGEVLYSDTGISSLQTDPYMKFTDEILNDTKNKLTKVIKPVSDALNSCDIESGC